MKKEYETIEVVKIIVKLAIIFTLSLLILKIWDLININWLQVFTPILVLIGIIGLVCIGIVIYWIISYIKYQNEKS